MSAPRGIGFAVGIVQETEQADDVASKLFFELFGNNVQRSTERVIGFMARVGLMVGLLLQSGFAAIQDASQCAESTGYLAMEMRVCVCAFVYNVRCHVSGLYTGTTTTRFRLGGDTGTQDL